jgi:hypothetical protein
MEIAEFKFKMTYLLALHGLAQLIPEFVDKQLAYRLEDPEISEDCYWTLFIMQAHVVGGDLQTVSDILRKLREVCVHDIFLSI